MLTNHRFIGKNIILKRDWLSKFTITPDAISLYGLIDYVEGVDYEVEDGNGMETRIFNSQRLLLAAFIIGGDLL